MKTIEFYAACPEHGSHVLFKMEFPSETPKNIRYVICKAIQLSLRIVLEHKVEYRDIN